MANAENIGNSQGDNFGKAKVTFEADKYQTKKWSGNADDAGDQSRIETNGGTKLAPGAGGPTKVG